MTRFPGAPHPATWLAAATLALTGCTQILPSRQAIAPLPQPYPNAGTATPRISGPVGTTAVTPTVSTSTTAGAEIGTSLGSAGAAAGNVSLDFADTDIREVVAQILGNTLHVNYTIDPSVHGSTTLRTVVPLSNAQLIPVLQSLLAQNAATLVQSGGVYRVLPAAAALGMAGGTGTAGGMMVPLRYASAEDLAKVLQPYLQNGAKLVGVPASNSLVISGEPGQRDALADLVRAFDIDELAGQSYALFPVENGSAQDFATALQTAFRAQQGGQLANVIHVVPLARVNAVLVISSSPRYIDDARRVYAVVERGRRQTMRTWHVFYLQNSTAEDIAYVLQQAFTPDNVTAQPTIATTGSQSGNAGSGINGIAGLGGANGGSSSLGVGGSSGGSSSGGLGGSSGGGLGGGSSGGGLGSGLSGGSSSGGLSGGQGAPTSAPASAGANPLLGGLSNSGGGGTSDPNAMRIIPNPPNNAILVYATGDEEATVESMLHKIDILPLQVRIDAIIAEVTLNDTLQYGTQFFFRHHAINGGLTQAGALVNGVAQSTANLPGFIFQAAGKTGDFVLDALQDVTTVKVLSSPELLVLDNQTAQLQVGNLVPYLTGSASVLTAGTAVVNSVDYRETGVITQVTPRVNSGGLVTLDIAQEVSGVDTTAASTGSAGSSINSPTFTERAVKSRVVVQDGQTVGLAGLITDTLTRANAGIPFLKDIPILGLIAGNQNNVRARTELLVLLTPHVLHDQRDARALTDDLREALPRAALAPGELQALPAGGSDDPLAPLRRKLKLR